MFCIITYLTAFCWYYLNGLYQKISFDFYNRKEIIMHTSYMSHEILPIVAIPNINYDPLYFISYILLAVWYLPVFIVMFWMTKLMRRHQYSQFSQDRGELIVYMVMIALLNFINIGINIASV